MLILTYTRGPPQSGIYLLKLCIYSYMFKLQSPSKSSPFDAVHLWRRFLYCSKQFLNSSILMPFTASAVFCFNSSMSAKCFPVRTIFIQGDKKKFTWGKSGWIGRVGHRGHAVFGYAVKSCWTLSTVWAGVLVHDPSWNEQTRWRRL